MEPALLYVLITIHQRMSWPQRSLMLRCIVGCLICQYDFDIIYRPGKNNIDADLLWRMEPRDGETEWQSISQGGVKSICQRVGVLGSSGDSPKYVEQLGAPPDCIPDVYAFPTRMQLNTLGQMSRQELMAAQGQDSLTGPTIHAMKCGKWSIPIRRCWLWKEKWEN